jgi:hypothetical protein
MNAFKTTLLSSIAVVAMAATAHAQTQNSTSNSDSTSGASSGSSSSSRAVGGNASGNRSQQNATQGVNSTTNTGVTLNQTSNALGSTSANNTDRVTGGTTNSNSNTGYTSSDNIVRTTPTVYAPPVSGGNPCTLAVSGGVSVIGWGAAAGGTFVDEDCATRQKIAMIHNAGYAQAARELMCNDKATYYAFRGTPTPCAPRAQFDGVATAGPVAPAPQPVPLGPQRVTSTQPPAFQPTGRFACMDARGHEVKAGTPGASCGYI